MSGIKDQDRMEELRRRLYERGRAPESAKKHELSDRPESDKPVAKTWDGPAKVRSDIKTKEQSQKPAVPTQPVVTTPSAETAPATEPTPTAIHFDTTNLATPATDTMAPKRKKRKYRLRLVLGGIIIFLLMIATAVAMLMFTNRDISGQNISVVATGPRTIGGGEVLPVQVAITNSNPVAIENATLVVEYPQGTKSATPDHQDLFNERKPLDTIKPNETINVPLRAIVYGQENAEEQIKVSIEYHITGSNATFVKSADPLKFQISTSPVVMQADTMKKVTSGQQTTVQLKLTSNAQDSLSNLVVKAEYPSGFNFLSADPQPNSGNNTWTITKLDPATSKTIAIKGIVSGNPNDQNVINFSVGVPSQRDSQTLDSILQTAQTTIETQSALLNVKLDAGGVSNGTVVLNTAQSTSINLSIANALQDSVYDLQVSVDVGGNAVSEVQPSMGGFYDSLHHTITWDSSNAPQLKALAPGGQVNLSFSVTPSADTKKNPQVDLHVNVNGRRVSESNVAQSLMGTASSTLKLASQPKLRSDITFSNGSFTNTGPVPPKANQTTTYTASFMVQNGVNDLSNAVVTAVLPVNVTWLGKTDGAGAFTYDPVQHLVTWNVGDVAAQGSDIGSFQVSVVPSTNQVGNTADLVKQQSLQATDAFTNTTVQATSPTLTTEMSTESGYPSGNGRVTQ